MNNSVPVTLALRLIRLGSHGVTDSAPPIDRIEAAEHTPLAIVAPGGQGSLANDEIGLMIKSQDPVRL
jgi:hypothetical protein